MSAGQGGRRGAHGLVAILLAGALGLGACSGADGGEAADPTATCDRAGCTDLPLEQIEEISGLDLPEGTEVRESSYRAFQDWYLSATLVLPEGAEDPTDLHDEPWNGELGSDGVYRTVESTDIDGRLTLEITAFTT